MDEHLTISTPEQVAFHYEMAGIGSRFVAALWDHVIITLESRDGDALDRARGELCSSLRCIDII